MHRRLVLLALAVATIALGLAVHTWMRGDVGGFIGDALYAVLIYLLVALIAPRAVLPLVAGVALAFCWAIELLQLTGLPAALSRTVPGASLVVGSTFQLLDLVAYAAGIGAAVGMDALSRRAAGSSRDARTIPSGDAPGPRPPAGTPSPRSDAADHR
jgi:hypothetical protein